MKSIILIQIGQKHMFKKICHKDLVSVGRGGGGGINSGSFFRILCSYMT